MNRLITQRRARSCVVLFPLLSACGAANSTNAMSVQSTSAVPPKPTDSMTPARPVLSGEINVFAAASLMASFKEMGAAFQAAHPTVKVTFNFGASSTLVQQIVQGAPVDVFASADASNMKKLTDAGSTMVEPVTFATNKLQIIVTKGNPKNVRAVADLADARLIVVSCGPDVPIGKYTRQVFDKAGITVIPKSLEPDVKAIVNKVTIGEADAGIVYATDILAAAGKAEGVVIPDDLNVTAAYPISVLKGTKNPPVAAAFVTYVASADGQTILTKYGFTR